VDVDDAVILTLAIWVVISSLLVKAVDVYVTLMLIGLLIVAEVAGNFINPETRQGLRPAIYFLLFIFLVIVAKKIMEVLS
jgi:hypothetical protein